MLRLLLLVGLLCAVAAPADAQRRTARRRTPPPPPPIIWLQPPQPAPIPILLLPPPTPAPLPVIVAAAPTISLPDAVRALLTAASRQNDPEAFAAVAKLARETNPANAGQIDALVAEQEARLAEAKARTARERADRLASAAFLELWKGELEAGASYATGNSNYLGLYGGAKLNREGLNWRHGFNARIDYQQTRGRTTTERAIIGWQPNYKVDDRLFVFGLAQYEHDRFLGYRHRGTAGTGLGYTFVSNEALRIELTGGPALRHTRFYEEDETTNIAGRASVSARWTITPGLTFAHDSALFLESGNNTATATTSIDTKLIGALKGRLSYNVTYESDPPPGRQSRDTLSRATLVYSF
jgi:putative salt-induced outer membrane protein